MQTQNIFSFFALEPPHIKIILMYSIHLTLSQQVNLIFGASFIFIFHAIGKK